jgi:predicted small metal-binding protein
MGKTIECRHSGIVCNAKVAGESDDDVLREAIEHARKKHGVDASRSTTLTGYLRTLIRDERDERGS